MAKRHRRGRTVFVQNRLTPAGTFPPLAGAKTRDSLWFSFQETSCKSQQFDIDGKFRAGFRDRYAPCYMLRVNQISRASLARENVRRHRKSIFHLADRFAPARPELQMPANRP